MALKSRTIQKSNLSEPARQFERIFEEYHNPEIREKRKILNNRAKRIEDKEKDLGL